MLVIDSLSTEDHKVPTGRTNAKSGSTLLRRVQRRTAARVLAISLATAAVVAPAAAATTMFSEAPAEAHVVAHKPVAPPAPPAPPAPTNFKPTLGILTSLFGERWGTQHLGIDIAAPIGTPIVAVSDGVVLEAGPADGFGQWVRVSQADGTTAVFGHVSQFFVAPGQHVKAGEVIAAVGNEGQSTGPHLHFEVWLADGTKIDPLPWLISLGIDLGPLSV